MKEKIIFLVSVMGAAVFGFLVAKFQIEPEVQIIEKEIQPEIALVQIKKVVGDSLDINISGPVRILWGEENLVENDGDYQIPLPQIPNENDLSLTAFPFTGNANTGKFYPSSSHFARCVAVEHRRSFDSKEAAIAAGFEPSKSVK